MTDINLSPVDNTAQTLPVEVKPRVDFRKCVEQYDQASRTYSVYGEGLKEFQQRAEKLQSFGVSSSYTAKKMNDLDLSPDMTVAKAMETMEAYSKDGELEVKKIARDIVKMDEKIKEENKVNLKVQSLWNVVPTESNGSFTARVLTANRVYINPLLPALVCFCFEGFRGALMAGLLAHTFNQLNIRVYS